MATASPIVVSLVLALCCLVAPASTQTSSTTCTISDSDLLFVVDGSGSLGKRNFNTTLHFVADIIDTLTIGENATR